MTDLLDRLHQKENEIARLHAALIRIWSALRAADNANNVETVGRAMEIALGALEPFKKVVCACGERKECDDSCMPDVIHGFCSSCGEPMPEKRLLSEDS